MVDDLKPNTEYAFRLAARSPQGLGAFTSVVRQRTLQSSRCLLDPALTCGGDLAGACALTRAGPAQGWEALWPIPPRSSASGARESSLNPTSPAAAVRGSLVDPAGLSFSISPGDSHGQFD